MSVDMTLEPWRRLPKLAPPGTNSQDIQYAADRYAITGDLYAAAADLWEEASMAQSLLPDDRKVHIPLEDREIRTITQDGISVTYASDDLIDNGMNARMSSSAKMMERARFFRSKAKSKSVGVHDPKYNPWLNRTRQYIMDSDGRVIGVEDDYNYDEIIVPVDDV